MPPQRPQGPPVGAGFPQRPMMMQGQRPPMAMMGPQGQQWPPRHPQEVTLQQRGPIGPGGPGGPPQMIGMRGPNPGGPPRMDQHPALMRQEPTPPPPPPQLNTKPMTPPPDNPQTPEDKAKVQRYEQWLEQHTEDINTHLCYYETEISKLRKQRKVSKCFFSIK